MLSHYTDRDIGDFSALPVPVETFGYADLWFLTCGMETITLATPQVLWEV